MPNSYNHLIKDSTLSCSPSEPQIEKTASEFLIDKCRYHTKNGKTTWTADSISGESYTYAQVDEYSRNVASALYKKGMRKGDIVVYMCYDIVKLHIFFNGVWRANGIPRSLYPEELEDSVLRTVVESKAKWILCDATEGPLCLAVAKKVNWDLEVITSNGRCDGCTSIYDLFKDNGNDCPALETSCDDPAIILCTSGTTGRSKGAVHSHRNLVNMWPKLAFHYALGETALYVSKGAHVSGAIMSLYSLVSGAELVTMSRLSVENVFDAVEKYKPTFIFAFPTFLIAFGTQARGKTIDTSSVKSILSGGTHLKPDFEEDLKLWFYNLDYLSNMYGLTESVSLIATTYRPSTQSSQIVQFQNLPYGTIGKVVLGVSAQVRDDTGTKILGSNEDGELCVKSTSMFLRYWGQEEETRNAFTSDGWFRTGDRGFYDENGYIFFTGRQKEMFKCFAHHVSPSTIDEVIGQHPSVADVCTIGVNDPDGEKMPRAFVVLKLGSRTTAEEIKEYAHENLPTYKHLRGGVYCVPSLPKGSSGKITRLLVSQMPLPE